MDDEERERISRRAREDADLANRVANLERGMGKIEANMTWGVRAIWGAAAYLLTQIWQFISQGGVMK